MNDFKLTYKQFSEYSILVEWPQEISEYILKDLLCFKNHLLNSNIKSIIQITNAYNSILVIYDCTIDNINDAFLQLKQHYKSRNIAKKINSKIFKIPVCYDVDFGLDLVEISEEKKLSIKDIIELHSSTIYTVYFVGFLPGFLYLGGLDERLHFPRKKNPRLEIKKGAVAIGGSQTGIYPNASPGGWNIIGNTPIELFLKKKSEPCFASSGDKIEFVPISRNEYDMIAQNIKNGTYQIESEVIDG